MQNKFDIAFNLYKSGNTYPCDEQGYNCYNGGKDDLTLSELLSLIKDIAESGYVHDLETTGSPGLITGVHIGLDNSEDGEDNSEDYQFIMTITGNYKTLERIDNLMLYDLDEIIGIISMFEALNKVSKINADMDNLICYNR